ncbi:hypothetical protein PWY87_07320 [Kribbella solani]|uniref:hypothetical protein n=1 Tax=Kribbella solani TaxID=236067 RepID=UPI0029B971EC|nr:hypothetical protein [Kribbella solani]MDX3001472.1 hypothetical protein [Kribbella solani]
MSGYIVIAGECPPGKDCPKVARASADRIVVVGELISDPAALAALGVGRGEAAVEISEVLYREAADLLAGTAGA